MLSIMCCIWYYRHSGSQRLEVEASDPSDTTELSTVDNLPIQHFQKSPQNVHTGILDDDKDLESSDLTIISSPVALDSDVDTTVEQTCEKIKLTASNVRSIIRVCCLAC